MERRGLFLMVLGAVLLLVVSAVAASQEGTGVVRRITTGDEVFMLPEVGALVIMQETDLKVDIVRPPDQREEAYREVDVRAGDIIMMMNGKRMKSAADLQAAYEALAIGDDLKLGIKRDKGMQIVSFAKGDIKGGPQMVMIHQGGPEGTVETEVTTGGGMQRVAISGDPTEMATTTALLDLGLLLGQDDGRLVVSQVLPMASEILTENTPTNGDVIVKMGGKEITSGPQLSEIYNGIEVGQRVSLTILRAGEELIATGSKPEPIQGNFRAKSSCETNK